MDSKEQFQNHVLLMKHSISIRTCTTNISTIKHVQVHIWVFPKIVVPQIIHFNRVFHYKPSILGYPYFWKHPYRVLATCRYNVVILNTYFALEIPSILSSGGFFSKDLKSRSLTLVEMANVDSSDVPKLNSLGTGHRPGVVEGFFWRMRWVETDLIQWEHMAGKTYHFVGIDVGGQVGLCRIAIF